MRKVESDSEDLVASLHLSSNAAPTLSFKGGGSSKVGGERQSFFLLCELLHDELQDQKGSKSINSYLIKPASFLFCCPFVACKINEAFGGFSSFPLYRHRINTLFWQVNTKQSERKRGWIAEYLFLKEIIWREWFAFVFNSHYSDARNKTLCKQKQLNMIWSVKSPPVHNMVLAWT